MKKLLAKLAASAVWARSPAGKTAIHRTVTAAIAVYVALHKAGV